MCKNIIYSIGEVTVLLEYIDHFNDLKKALPYKMLAYNAGITYKDYSSIIMTVALLLTMSTNEY